MYCVKCGKEIIGNPKYCGSCGAPVQLTLDAIKQIEINGSFDIDDAAYNQKQRQKSPKQNDKFPTAIIIAMAISLGLVIISGLAVLNFTKVVINEPKIETVSETETIVSEEEEEIRVLTSSEIEEGMLKISEGVDPYIFMCLYNYVTEGEIYQVGEGFEVNFEDFDSARAAIATSADDAGSDDYYDLSADYSAVKADLSKAEKYCEVYFGRELNISTIHEWNNTDYFYAMDIVRVKDEPAKIVSKYVHEYEYEPGEYTASAEDYKVVCEGYFGDEKYNPDGTGRNFKIEFVFREDLESEFGVVLSEVSAEKIADEREWIKEEEVAEGDEAEATDGDANVSDTDVSVNEASGEKAFWGLWVYSDADVNVANQVAEALIGYGIDARVYLASDWSELPDEAGYMVTAGVYETEYDASMLLSVAKDAGYTDVYVKYSGEHK